MTLRDEVWDEVIKVITEDGKFKISDLPFDESQRHTVRRVLREMEERNYLYRESQNAKIWRAGDTAEETLNIDEETMFHAKN